MNGRYRSVLKKSVEKLTTIGQDLARPECVLATSNGNLYTSDWRGGVTVLNAKGKQRSFLSRDQSFTPKPNGIALLSNGEFLLCHLGDESGGVFQLNEEGDLQSYLLEVDKQILPPANYVHLDSHGGGWITVSTTKIPRAAAYRRDVADGFIIYCDKAGAKIVADNLGYTNECVVSPCANYLYVNETFAKRLSRFKIHGKGQLGKRETVAEFGVGTFPDGLTFDSEGRVWITSIISNRVIRVTNDGHQTLILEDADHSHLQVVESAYRNGQLGRPHLDQVKSEKLKNISSLAFGGKTLKIAYLGCLLGDSIYSMTAPIAGWTPPHWNFSGPSI